MAERFPRRIGVLFLATSVVVSSIWMQGQDNITELLTGTLELHVAEEVCKPSELRHSPGQKFKWADPTGRRTLVIPTLRAATFYKVFWILSALPLSQPKQLSDYALASLELVYGKRRFWSCRFYCCYQGHVSLIMTHDDSWLFPVCLSHLILTKIFILVRGSTREC